jgi:hypothetical protein
MDWLEILNQAFQTAAPALMSALSMILIFGLCRVIKDTKNRVANDTTEKYFKMLEITITNAVLATTQTYVDAMKKENAFDKEAQKKAFNMTYEAVMKVLTDEAKRYLEAAVGDLSVYITNQIEATVKLTK